MAIVLKERDPRPLTKKGKHLGRCISVIDLGIQPGGKFAPKHQLLIAFEFPNLRIKWKDKEGEEREGPERMCKFYTASLSEKAWLRKHLEAWLDRPLTREELKGKFDLRQLLNMPVEARVIHKPKKTTGEMKADISDLSPPGEGVKVPEVQGKLWYYSPPEAVDCYDELPEWLQSIIKRQHGEDAMDAELPAPSNEAANGESLGDDIPF